MPLLLAGVRWVVGFDLFDNRVVTIDFPKARLSFAG